MFHIFGSSNTRNFDIFLSKMVRFGQHQEGVQGKNTGSLFSQLCFNFYRFFIKMIILFFGKKLHILRFFVVFIVFKNSVPTKQTRVRHNFVVFVKFPDKCTFSDCVRVTKLCVFFRKF